MPSLNDGTTWLRGFVQWRLAVAAPLVLVNSALVFEFK